MSNPIPWSITTTVRNPYRLQGFLKVLSQLENSQWNYSCQIMYQILLIQNRLYGYGSKQFYDGLSQEQIKLLDNPLREIPFEKAQEIFDAKLYVDPAMRGRQSFSILKKLGFLILENNSFKITELGRKFLQDDIDLGEIFLRIFLKWQIPNPISRAHPPNSIYNIKPFVGTLHLINTVNNKEFVRGNVAKGLSRQEFSLFVPTLINYKDIEKYAGEIIALRDTIKGQNSQKQQEIFTSFQRYFASKFLGTNNERAINNLLKNLQDYGDNTIRYFRLTRYLYIRGGGYYIDIEPRRSVEIESLFEYDNAQARKFESAEEYQDFLSDISQPQLPWETRGKYLKAITKLIEEIQQYEVELKGKTTTSIPLIHKIELKAYIAELRLYRRQLQDEINRRESQSIEKIEEYIKILQNIFAYEDRPKLLKKISALGLQSLNDAIKIQPNYPVGDDNEPTFTAAANHPDIECYYEGFNAICEVTMLKTRSQWFNEGQPVMRHLRDFENKNGNKPSYCLFIAPALHRDTINTFWTSVKYEYEGRKQKIVPISIYQFVSILKVLVRMKKNNLFLKHSEIARLFDEILNSVETCNDSEEWVNGISGIIDLWSSGILAQV